MKREYKVSSHNSTVCGYPGRGFDWNKFCWDASEIRVDKCFMPNCLHKHETPAPLPHVDDYLIGAGCQYLHVPYDWAKSGTIYRVRPNESMRADKTYRGQLIKSVKAFQKSDGWYWVLDF